MQQQQQQRPTPGQPQQQQRPPSAQQQPQGLVRAQSGGSNGGVMRGPAPTSSSGGPSRSSSSSALDIHREREVECVDGVPLVAEVYENQRCYPMIGWSSKLMDRPPFSNEDGSESWSMQDFKVPPGWSWQGEWQVEVLDDPAQLKPGQCLTDKDGWVYATDFSRHFRGSADSTLKAVRRRRHFRRRVPPAKSVKAALGLASASGAAANSLTVGYLRNPLSVASSNTLSVRGASASTMSLRGAKGGARPAGAGPSLAELYAKQTVEPAPAATPSATSPSSAAAIGSPSPAPASAASPTPGFDAALSPQSAAAASSPIPADSAAASAAANGALSLNAAAGTIESPSLRPSYRPFSGPSMAGGLESLSAGFGGFGFKGASASAAPRVEKSLVRLWEHQRYYPMVGWSATMLPTDRGGRRGGWLNEADPSRACDPRDSFQPGAGWVWSMPEWNLHVDAGVSTDAEGWSYAVEPSLTYHAKKGLEHFVRKRLWVREKTQRAAADGSGSGNGARSAAAAGKKSYTQFFERLELLKKDLQAEELDDDLVSMLSATW